MKEKDRTTNIQTLNACTVAEQRYIPVLNEASETS